MSRYALICVDVPHADVDRLFHYAVPPEMEDILLPGMRVLVPFGKGNKPTAGYAVELSDSPGEDVPPDKIKPVAQTLDGFPVFTEETLTLARWMKEKYYSLLISCLKCVQPAGLPAVKFAASAVLPAKQRKPRKQKASEPSASQPELIRPPELTDEQQSVVNRIKTNMQTGDNTPVLLHGVTGSGKTEVYLQAISEALAQGKDAVVLVPEIALTPQTVGVFTGRFGVTVAVTHSRLSAGERFRIWKQAMDGEIKIIIGPRSAVFMPFKNLGIIVIDEEHEHTYQSETAPKFHARDVAFQRARLTGALVLMGSATPSLESYYKAQPFQKEYILEKLTERVNKTFPQVKILDMRRELAEGNPSMFSRALKTAIGEALSGGHQVILFLNRRGHSGFVSCRWCGHVLACPQCRVNYTYHASGYKDGRLLCHYCGGSVPVPEKCPACGSEYIRYFGAGTQKIEEEMAALFPDAACLRMDMDTTRGKHGHAKIFEAFRKNEAQILIGTQMIAKGLDFPNVTLVGVVAADMSLFTGDFRAGEHTFQLLTQVSGRSGRAGETGRVLLQTYNPEHYCLALAERGDYEAFYRHEISLRESMCYPPFSHVFSVMLTGPDEKEIIKALGKLLAIMHYCKTKRQDINYEIMGMSPAFISKIKNQYRWKLLVKCTEEEPLKRFVLYCVKKLRENDPLDGITAHLSLDPIMME